ncbi:Uncharacterised protein [Candidatus Tiddalikarchaeum anstoanum]|nr:Uncharacterised protein [Candidatus Tiddalikarchaeum anstoanum]
MADESGEKKKVLLKKLSEALGGENASLEKIYPYVETRPEAQKLNEELAPKTPAIIEPATQAVEQPLPEQQSPTKVSEIPTQQPEKLPIEQPIIPQTKTAEQTPTPQQTKPSEPSPTIIEQKPAPSTEKPISSPAPQKPIEHKVEPAKFNIINFIKEHNKIFLFSGGGLVLLIIIFFVISLFSGPGNNVEISSAYAGEGFSTVFTTSGNYNNILFVFTHPSGEVEQVTPTRNGNTWTANNLNLLISGDWTLEVKSGSEILFTKNFSVSSSCSTNSDCDGTLCCNGACVEPECSSNTECRDTNNCTIDTCLSPSTCESSCQHQAITNLVAGDYCCPEGATFFTDTDCTTCPVGKIFCNNSCRTLTCTRNADCNDNNTNTFDVCQNGGTCSAFCQNYIGSPCTANQITCNGTCTDTCRTNSDCDDSNNATIDLCNNPNSCSSQCIHSGGTCTQDSQCSNSTVCCGGFCISPVCSMYTQCDDGNPLTNDYCQNPGTCSASCSNTQCTVACSRNGDCNGGRTCYNVGTCSSVCAFCQRDTDCSTGQLCCSGNCITPSCLSDSQCSFGQTCNNPNSCTASCSTRSCSQYTDCMSGYMCCNNLCTKINSGEQYWPSAPINQTLMIGGNNISNLVFSSYNPGDSSVLVRIYKNATLTFVPNTRNTLPYTYNNATYGFNLTIGYYSMSTNSAPVNWSVYCPNGSYSKNYNTCDNACVECLTDSHCSAGKVCCSEHCATPACNSSLTNSESVPSAVAATVGTQYAYVANSTGVIYYDGYQHSLPSITNVIGLEFSTDLYAATSTGSVKKYSGGVWTEIFNTNNATNSLHVYNSDTIYAGLGNGSIFKDNAGNVTIISQFNASVNKMLTFDNKLVAGLGNGELYYYDGNIWTLGSALGSSINNMVIFNSQVYAGLVNGKIYRSSTLNSWSEDAALNGNITLLAVANNKLFAGLNNGDVYVYASGWVKMENAGGLVVGIFKFGTYTYIVDQTYGIKRYDITGCAGYCYNKGTCSAGCLT